MKLFIRRIADNHGGTILLLVIAIASVVMLACVFYLVSGLVSGLFGWVTAITDPTERGAAYIAAAIVFHALFGK